jgi:hypothetical protein
MPNWKTIMVGYDGKHASNLALSRAADLAEEAGAKLVVTSSARLLVGAARGVGPLDPAHPPSTSRSYSRRGSSSRIGS